MKNWLIAFTSLLTITNSTIIITTNTNYVNQIEEQNINVNISAYDENNKKLTSFHYETTFATLGDLMDQEKNTYLLKDFGSPLGLYLYGISYYNDQGQKETKLEEPNETFWAFWYINDKGEEEFSQVGISSYYLTHETENIIWRYRYLKRIN